jgi:hypothetical protein
MIILSLVAAFFGLFLSVAAYYNKEVQVIEPQRISQR